MKKLFVSFALFAFLLASGIAMGGTKYHVYKKKGSSKCSIEMRNHKQWKSARGSGWKCLGHFSSRLSAMKLFKKSGCTK